MGRAILAVFTGDLVTALVVSALFTGAFLARGDERTYQPGTCDVSTLCVAIVMPASVDAARRGGFVCRAVARRATPVKVLAFLVAILGTVEAGYVLSGMPDPEPRTEPVGMLDAAGKSRPPTCMTTASPIIGVVGILHRRMRPRGSSRDRPDVVRTGYGRPGRGIAMGRGAG